MRLTTSFPVCSSAEHNGWDSELWLPYNSQSMSWLTQDIGLIKVPGHCVSILTNENYFFTLEKLLRYGGGTKKQ